MPFLISRDGRHIFIVSWLPKSLETWNLKLETSPADETSRADKPFLISRDGRRIFMVPWLPGRIGLEPVCG
jgi:hypothetical protein